MSAIEAGLHRHLRSADYLSAVFSKVTNEVLKLSIEVRYTKMHREFF